MKIFLNDEELEDHHFDEIRINYKIDANIQDIKPLGEKDIFEFECVPMKLSISLQLIKDDWGMIFQTKEREMQ